MRRAASALTVLQQSYVLRPATFTATTARTVVFSSFSHFWSSTFTVSTYPNVTVIKFSLALFVSIANTCMYDYDIVLPTAF